MINRERLKALHKIEEERFLTRTPKSRERFNQAKKVMPGGVPMSWMTKWPGAYPVFVASANGAHFVDLDRKSTRLNSSHVSESRMPSSA